MVYYTSTHTRGRGIYSRHYASSVRLPQQVSDAGAMRGYCELTKTDTAIPRILIWCTYCFGYCILILQSHPSHLQVFDAGAMHGYYLLTKTETAIPRILIRLTTDTATAY